MNCLAHALLGIHNVSLFLKHFVSIFTQTLRCFETTTILCENLWLLRKQSGPLNTCRFNVEESENGDARVGRCAHGTVMTLYRLRQKLFLFIHFKENILGFSKWDKRLVLRSALPFKLT